jgi:hypothetical protein
MPMLPSPTYRLAEVARIPEGDPLQEFCTKWRSHKGQHVGPFVDGKDCDYSFTCSDAEAVRVMENRYGLTGRSCDEPGGGLSCG